jgi:nucleotide-binding universal stress UspA family protein
MTVGEHASAAEADPTATPELRSIACVVTAVAGDLEAVRQAACLAEGGRLTLIAARPHGARDRAGLAAARRLAAGHGLEPDVRVVDAPPAAPTVHLLAGGHDLLVVAAPAHGLDGVARAAVRQSPVPVLVARPRPDGARVADRLLVASDGADEAWPAVALAHDIARAHGSALAAVVPAPLTLAPELMVLDLTHGGVPDGTDPAVVPVSCGVADALVTAAAAYDATLLVIGCRGLSGVAGLASVSARVAERAACSVLVVRPRA